MSAINNRHRKSSNLSSRLLKRVFYDNYYKLIIFLFSEVPLMEDNKSKKRLTTAAGAPVPNNDNSMTAGPRGPMLLQDVWFLEKLAHFDREVIPERRMHAKGSGAYGTFTVTNDITEYTKAKRSEERRVGKESRDR